MAERTYVCAYPHCLHHGEKVLGSEAVMIGKRRYHWDCAAQKQEIKECIDTYMEYVDDKTQFPMATKIINNIALKDKVPIEFVRKNIETSRRFYGSKPVYVLYGLRKLFWEKEFKITAK